MGKAKSQPDALALADSVKFAIQHRDEEIERLKAECINELMGQKESLDTYYEKRISALTAEGARMRDALEYIDRPLDHDLTGDNARAMIVCAHGALNAVSGKQCQHSWEWHEGGGRTCMNCDEHEPD